MPGTDRITIRNDLSIIDVDVNVTISDLKVPNELPEVEIGNARCGIGVRIVSEPIRMTVLGEGSAELVHEVDGDLAGIGLCPRRGQRRRGGWVEDEVSMGQDGSKRKRFPGRTGSVKSER